MFKGKIVKTILTGVSTILALISVIVMILMWIGIVRYQFDIQALALTFIFAVFGHIIVRILNDEPEELEKLNN